MTDSAVKPDTEHLRVASRLSKRHAAAAMVFIPSKRTILWGMVWVTSC